MLRVLPFGPLARIRRFRQDPAGAQARLLRGLLREAAGTEWGARYGFGEIARRADVVRAYREGVPVHPYEAFREDVRRVRGGEAGVFWPGRFRHFAVSSGTASAGKIIPLSRRMLDHDRDFSIASVLHFLAVTGERALLAGRHLTLPGRIEEDPAFPGTWIGEVSGLLAAHAPFYVRRFWQAVPNEISFLPHWERKLAAIVDRTLGMDVRLLALAPSWALVLFDLLAERYRARHGRTAGTIGEIWPNLRLVVTGGVALSSYRALLEARIGLPGVRFLETYGASEGFFSFQDRTDDPAMLLHLDAGVYYEFVRFDELGAAHPRRLTIAEVETEVRYVPVISTCSGLWAYPVGDVVRFTSLSPHRILVAGRTSEMLDRYGEAVFGEEAQAALDHACARAGGRVRHFHVAPLPPGPERPPAHQWLVEFETPPADVRRFADQLDGFLAGVNRHYQIRREARAFGPPEVVPVPGGVFYEWLRRTKERISGQTKVPRMSEERFVAEGVLSILSEQPGA